MSTGRLLVRRAGALALLASLFLLLDPAPVRGGEALPRVEPPPIQVTDVDGNVRPLPGRTVPIVLVYEDRKSERQNQHVYPLLGKLRRADNAEKIELVAVADVEEYDFWPAKQFVIAHVRRIIKKEKTPIWFDWRGLVRRGLGLVASQSAIVLMDPDGSVRWSGQGPLTDEQQATLVQELQRAGVTLD